MSPLLPLWTLNSKLEELEPDKSERINWLIDRLYHENTNVPEVD
jgi:hypothetical protein